MRKKTPGKLTEKFSSFTVKYRWPMAILFIVLSVACAVAIPFIKIVYDVSSYLPDESTASVGLSVLKEEFDDKGMTYVILSDVSPAEAKEVAGIIGETEGVASVIFEENTSYNKETGAALLTVSFTDYDSTQGCFSTMERLIKTCKPYNATFVGQSASSYYTKLETEESILKIGVVIVAIIIVMLIVTSKSYFEIVPMLVNFGVAVLLNMGTNVFFNGISYISNLVSLVLQLALSIDYSVILMHRYMEEISNGLAPKEAAIAAQTKGIPEILSSSLTTVAGMGALMFMSLGIGVEIGLALTKGIVFSLLTVIFLMPALLVLFAKPLNKSRHRSFLPNIVKPTKVIVKARKIIVPIFLVLVILAGSGQYFNKYSFSMVGGAKITAGKETSVEKGFGTMNTLVIVLPNDGDSEKQHQVVDYVMSFDVVDSTTMKIADGVYMTDAFTKEEAQEKIPALMSSFGGEGSGLISENLAKAYVGSVYNGYCEKYNLPETAKVPLIDLLIFLSQDETYSALIPSDFKDGLSQLPYAKANLFGENYVRMTFNINAGVEDEKAFDLIAALKTGLKDYYDTYYMTGETVVCHDMSEYFPQDNRNIALFTLAFILLILFITFKNMLLPILLALAIQGGIWINFIIPFLVGYPLCFIGYLIITAIQMGATIDYAIVLTNRYYTIRNQYEDRLEAMAVALNAVFPTIMTSGVILTVTGFTLAAASSGVVSAMGSLLGAGAALSVGIVLLILPSFLLVTEKATDLCEFSVLFKKLLSRRKK